MVKEEITIEELLKEFNLKIKLNERLLLFEVSSDFLKAELTEEKSVYTFSVDSVVLIINPKSKKETIQKLVIKDDKVMGGIILGEDSVEYLN